MIYMRLPITRFTGLNPAMKLFHGKLKAKGFAEWYMGKKTNLLVKVMVELEAGAMLRVYLFT